MNAQRPLPRSGVFATPPGAAMLRQSVESNGGRWIEADLHAVQSKAELLQRLAEAAELPPHFGRNWDALADCLQDLPVPAAGCVLRLLGVPEARAALADERATLIEIARDAVAYWETRGRPFVFFLDGAGELPPWR